MTTKRCTKCGLEKPLDDFYYYKSRQHYLSRCKTCTNADNIARAAANPKKHNARTKAWRKAHPGRASEVARAWQLRNPAKAKQIAWWGKYRIDFETVWQAQNGLCASCQLPMRKEGREPDSVCVDHDRRCCPGKKSCGKCVRGLIHRNCNLVLGYADDDLKVLRSAIAYLERWESVTALR